MSGFWGGTIINNYGGTISVKQIEIDFGVIPTRTKLFTISDTSVSYTSNIVLSQSGDAPTGKSADENEMDTILFSAISGSGQFMLIASAINGPVVGKYKVNYTIG